MASTFPDDPKPPSDSEPNFSKIEEEDDEEEEDEEEEIEPELDRSKMQNLFNRIRTEKIHLRVHDVIIKGNTKTKDSVIESITEPLKSASTMQELLVAANDVQIALQSLDIFDSVSVVLDSGPSELPGTSNVVVQVTEAKRIVGADIGMYTKPEARSWSTLGSLRLRNLFGYGDIWDASLGYGWNQASEISTGVSLPQFRRLITPVTARVYLHSQDWLKFSSYKEQSLGLSLGLLSSENHDLSYNLSWRTLMDPSQMSSRTVRSQLGHRSVSALKYAFRIDRRNSSLRPTRGYAFFSTSQIGGLFPDLRSTRFLRQEFDFRYALPLGFYRAALNFGISAGILLPWGPGSSKMPSYLPERYFVGGNCSPVCTIGGPISLWGFKTRGLGPAEPRRQVREDTSIGNHDCSKFDSVGGDLALTAFVDLSFDLPLKVLRDAGIHGHAFACTGTLNKLTENAYRDISSRKFFESFRSSAGFGIVVPTKFFRMEVNYCHILKQQEYDRGKTGLQFSFSSPM